MTQLNLFKEMPKEHAFEFNHLNDQINMLNTAINKGNWKSYPESLKIRKDNLRTLERYKAVCISKNKCELIFIADINEYLKLNKS
jgi:hypothetical protein